MKKTILLPAFLLMVAAQLYIPLQLVKHSEHILETGKVFKFPIAPVYYHSPAQGSYIQLTYYGNTIQTDRTEDWVQNEQVYVALRVDSAGYATIDYVSKEIPSGNTDYVNAFVDYVIEDSISSLVIRYPFNRFYLEASMKTSERPLYTDPPSDPTSISYAIVTIKDGEAIVTDVVADGISIKDQPQQTQ